MNAEGNIRGYLKESNLGIDHELDSFDTSPFFGPGFLSITKHIANNGKPFTGQVMLEHGTLAKELVHYFHTSEQIPTAVILSVFFDKKGEIAGAGGLFLQAMPDAEDDALKKIENEIIRMPSLGKYFAGKNSRKGFIKNHFSSFEPVLSENQDVKFYCPCSKERFSAFLSSISDNEKSSILTDRDFPLKTSCFNCNSTYEFPEKEIHTLFSN